MIVQGKTLCYTTHGVEQTLFLNKEDHKNTVNQIKKFEYLGTKHLNIKFVNSLKNKKGVWNVI